MRKCSSCNRLRVFALLAASHAVVAVHADEYDAFNFYASQVFQRDDNLFRLPNGIDPQLGNGQRDDLISVTSLNARLDKTYSLQRLKAEITAAHSAYQEYDYLDYTATGGSLGWNWALGKQWSGLLSVSQSQALRGFADSANTQSSINTYRRLGGDINYWWHPEWSAGVGVVAVTSRYSDSASDNSEYDEDTIEIKVNFQPSTLNVLSLVASETDGSYPNRDALNTFLFDDEYTQRNLQLRGNWLVAGHSRVSGYLGGSDREYPQFSERDFRGLTGRLSYDWTPTSKLSLNVLARREIGAEADLVDNFVVTESVSMAPAWALTSDFSIGAGYEWRKRTYGGNPALGVVSDVGKDDTTDIARLSGNYAPIRNLKFTVLVQREARDSNNSAREYDADLVSAAVQFNW